MQPTTRSAQIQSHLDLQPQPLASSEEAIEAVNLALYDLKAAGDAAALFQIAAAAIAAAQAVTLGKIGA